MNKVRLAAVMLLLFLLAGCSDFFFPVFLAEDPTPAVEPTGPPVSLPGARPEVRTFGIPFYPVESFNPLTNAYRHNRDMARLGYEGLVELDETFAPQYVLASQIHTTDNITFTITLNPDARFSNGEPVRPEDVRYSYELAQTPGGPYAERLGSVVGVSVSGENVVITMAGPVFNAVALMDVPIVQGGAGGPVAVGTGPYAVHLNGDESFLLQNETWWRGTGPLPIPRIELVPARVPGDLVIGFGQTYISVMPLDVFDTLAPGIRGSSDRIHYPTPLMQYIGFNMANDALRNPEVRRALAMALDREAVAGGAYGPLADPAALPVPPSSALYDEDLSAQFLHDPAAAGRLLDGQGIARSGPFRYRGRNRFALRFIVDAGSPERVKAAQAYAGALRVLGVEVDMRLLGWEAFLAALDEGDYDIYYAEALPLPNFSPRALVGEGGVFNHGGFSSAEMNEALWALETAAEAGRQAAAAEVWRLFYEQMPAIVVCFRRMQLFSQFGMIEGLSPTFGNPYRGWGDAVIHR